MRDFRRLIEADMQFMSYAPVIFISVKDKQRINQVIEMAEFVSEKRALRVPTGQLKRMNQDAILMIQPPTEDLLRHAGRCQAAVVQLPDQPQRPDAFFLRAIFGKQDQRGLRF